MDELIESLREVVGSKAVLSEPDELLVYECDGLPQHKYLPRAVVFPDTTEATAEVMRVLTRFNVPFTPRGAGTGLSGGALALNRGVVIELARMRKLLRIDQENRIAVVQTGIVNLNVSKAVAHLGLHYIPDPSSQPTCTIGGNIAENAGGIHCLKYGTTTDHVLGARVVLAGGEVVDLTSGETGFPGYDLLGAFIGSEGTFGIATEATLRLTPLPPAVRTLLADFLEVDDASQAVSAIIAAGVMPAALEMMDHEIIKAIEASVFAAGLPPDAGAALLIELDGIEAGIDAEAERVRSICMSYGARSCRLARDENERKKLWAARKGAFGAIGRIAPDSMIQDTVVPRSRLPEVMRQSYRIAEKYGLILANVFHAGDGNLHPFICFDSRSPEQVLRVKEAGRELMETCVRAGGSITGEHGVGFDKRDYLPLIFSDDDMETMLSVRAAYDPFGLCNPGKIIPMLRGCGEARIQSESGNGDRNGIEFASIRNAVASSYAEELKSQQARSIVTARSVQTESTISNLSQVEAPQTTREVSELTRVASANGSSIIPSGSGSWIFFGNATTSSGKVLKTTNLNRIIEHEPADLIARAEAGVTLKDFNAHLSQQGQWLPLDPPDNGESTLGGVVASGISGAQGFGYGPPRRYVIGMTVVLASGKVVKVGGRVVKNVAGYDLCKLFAGSFGTLGVITELTFKLRPLPQAHATLVASGKLESLLTSSRRLITEKLFPVAVEVMSATAANALGLSEEAALLVRFSGSADGVAQQSAAAAGVLSSVSTVRTFSSDEPATWQAVSALPYQFGEHCIWRAILPPADLRSFLSTDVVHKDGRIWTASIGEGRVRVVEPSGAAAEQLASELANSRKRAVAVSGSLVIENADREMKSRIDAWGELGTRAGLMRRVKQKLDPQNILSPGRFFRD